MKPLMRWLRFNFVGLIGMAVQLGALALLGRWMGRHYLWASAAALEVTLLHNFVWHVRFTWRDRVAQCGRARQFVRFHLSSGLVSLLGNLAVMRLLVHGAHVPLVVANLIAILCCSLVNFWVGDRWAFAAVGAMPVSNRVDGPMQRGCQ